MWPSWFAEKQVRTECPWPHESRCGQEKMARRLLKCNAAKRTDLRQLTDHQLLLKRQPARACLSLTAQQMRQPATARRLFDLQFGYRTDYKTDWVIGPIKHCLFHCSKQERDFSVSIACKREQDQEINRFLFWQETPTNLVWYQY